MQYLQSYSMNIKVFAYKFSAKMNLRRISLLFYINFVFSQILHDVSHLHIRLHSRMSFFTLLPLLLFYIFTMCSLTTLGAYSYVSCRMLLTLSSTATFLVFHTNSHTAITHATPIPPISTTKTPPMLARPRALAVPLAFVVSS